MGLLDTFFIGSDTQVEQQCLSHAITAGKRHIFGNLKSQFAFILCDTGLLNVINISVEGLNESDVWWCDGCVGTHADQTAC